MSTGLIALVDDIAALAKMAAASLDDAAAQAVKAGGKAAGIVIDDAAVTPRYVVGLASDRELPIIRKIAVGSLRNKLLILLPGALALSYFAPLLITPLLMVGGAFLCLEGFHKVADLVSGKAGASEAAPMDHCDPQRIENERVASAVRTDFILSAEIMAITLGTVSQSPIWLQAGILAGVGVAMTVAVYGVVAMIVKADDAGVAMARTSNGLAQAMGRAMVRGMPAFLKGLSLVGMLAMLWVGGGILVHGLHQLGLKGPEEFLHHLAEGAARMVGVLPGGIAWFTQASISGLIGIAVGAMVDRVLALVKRRA